MAKYDPMILIGAALGAATIALAKPKEPITPAQMLGNMCAAFAFGYFAPDAVATFWPAATGFMGIVAFLCAVIGVSITATLVKRGPALTDRILSKKVDAALGETKE
jgi:hypothetical protein